MKIIRKISKLAAILLAFHMLLLSGLSHSVWAAMISTESIMHVDQGLSQRDYLNNLVARERIQTVIESYGIDPREARNRIDHLSDDEIAKFVHEIDQLPAGGGTTAGVVTYFIIFLFLVVIDLYYNNPTPDD